MNVIDKLLSEWSYRCSDGIVDLTDVAKVKILFEILKEDIDDDLLNALIKADPDTKSKVLKRLQKIGKEEDTELETELYKKRFSKDIAEQVSLFAIKYNIEDELLDYIKNPQLFFSDLGESGNLFEIIKSKTGMNDGFVKRIITYTPTEGNKGLGIGEIALVLFFDAEKQKVGDVKMDGKMIELKGTEARFPRNGKGRSGDISYLYNNLSEKYGIESKINLAAYIYKIIKENPEALDYINTELNNIYPNTEDIKITSDNINNILNKKYVSSYVKNYPENDYYMLISKYDLNYNIYTPEELVESVGDGTIKLTNISKTSSYPQLQI